MLLTYSIQQSTFRKLILFSFEIHSDPVLHSSTGERSDVQTLLQKLILEENQFSVEDILPNTVPDPSSLNLASEYACPVGQVVMVPDCGEYYNENLFQFCCRISKKFCVVQFHVPSVPTLKKPTRHVIHAHWEVINRKLVN